MNSIINTHFDLDADLITSVEAAVERLSHYLDTEIATLRRVLGLAGTVGVLDHFEALDQLHLTPRHEDVDLRELLEEAGFRLEILQVATHQIPSHCSLAVAHGPKDYDAMVRWSTARLHDVIATINHALGR